MPAAIFGQRFLGRREPAWHGLGTVFTDPIDPPTAVLMAGADYHIQKYPLVVHLPDGRTLDSDRVAIVREPTHDDGSYNLLGYAGKDYEVVQNLELGFMLEELAKIWPLETLGVLGSGETIFLTLDAGTTSVGGEEIHQYFLLANSHTGKRGLKIALTPVRVVCQNTLIAGTQAASVISTLAHTVNVRAEANLRIDIIANMRRQQQHLLESFEAMAHFKVGNEERDQIIAAAYPMPAPPKRKVLGDIIIKDGALAEGLAEDRKTALTLLQGYKSITDEWERECKRMETHRLGAVEQYALVNQESPVVAGTAWAVWQGVTATECWKEGSNQKDKAESAKSVNESILFGERAARMGKAYDRAMSIMGYN